MRAPNKSVRRLAALYEAAVYLDAQSARLAHRDRNGVLALRYERAASLVRQAIRTEFNLNLDDIYDEARDLADGYLDVVQKQEAEDAAILDRVKEIEAVLDQLIQHHEKEFEKELITDGKKRTRK